MEVDQSYEIALARLRRATARLAAANEELHEAEVEHRLANEAFDAAESSRSQVDHERQ